MESSLVCAVVELNVLKPSVRNARTHDKRQIRQIADSIKTFGFTNPLLVDENNGVIAGHGYNLYGNAEHADKIGSMKQELQRLRKFYDVPEDHL